MEEHGFKMYIGRLMEDQVHQVEIWFTPKDPLHTVGSLHLLNETDACMRELADLIQKENLTDTECFMNV